MSRVLCLACVLMLFSSLLLSCSDEGDPVSNSDNTVSSSVSDGFGSDVGIADTGTPEASPARFDGATVRVLCEENMGVSDLCFSEGYQSEYSRLAFERDNAIRQTHDVCISYENERDVFSRVESCLSSGDAPHIVYASGGGGISELMMYGYLYDLGEYVDEATIYSSGMSASALRQLSVEGKVYIMTGAPIRSSVSCAVAVGYNKRLLSDFGYSSDHIDDLVTEGLWTHDAMHVMARVCERTAVQSSADSMYYLWQGMGAATVEKLPGDVPSISIYTPRNLFFFEHVHEYYAEKTDKDINGALFVIDRVGKIGDLITSDTALAPLPSFSEKSGYNCVMDFDSTYFTAIPRGVAQTQLAGCYLDALYSESVNTVYGETLREYNYGNETILDVILRSRHFDLLEMYGIGHIIRSAFAPESTVDDFDRLLAERAEFAERALDITLGYTNNR